MRWAICDKGGFMKIAVYQDEGILSVEETIQAAIEAAGYEMRDVTSFTGGNYDNGVVVDMIHCKRVSADSESASGASAKIRYISDELAAQVESNGGNIEFDINSDGYLDQHKD